MINEMIKKVYYPVHEDEWIVVETDRAFYELRLGGYRATTQFKNGKHKSDKFPDNILVKEAYTDEENLYLRLSNNHYLIHGPSIIDSDGVVSFGVRISSSDQFITKYGESFFLDPYIRKLKTDHQGNSL